MYNPFEQYVELELLAFPRSTTGFEMLTLVDEIFGSDGIPVQLKFEKRDQRIKQRASSVSHWVRANQDLRFSSLEGAIRVKGVRIGDIPVSSLRFELGVSPTSSLWDRPATWSFPLSNETHNAYVSALSHEYSYKQQGVRDCPHFLIVDAGFDRRADSDQFVDSLAERIRQVLESYAGDMIIVGSANNRDGTVIRTLHFLIPFPRAVPDLRYKFFDLQPLLIGYGPSCRRIHELFPADTRLIPIAGHDDSVTDMAMVRISRRLADDASARAVLSDVLVAKDDTTRHVNSYDYKKGEIILGGRLLYTKERLDYLLAEDRIPVVDNDPDPNAGRWIPIIAPEHAEMAGIPESVWLMRRAIRAESEELYAFARDEFANLSGGLPTRDKIWLSYKAAYRKSMMRLDADFIEFVRQRLFPEQPSDAI